MAYERTPENLDDWDDRTRDLGSRGRESPSQNGTTEENGRRSLKRDRDDGTDLDEQIHANWASANGVSFRQDGSSDMSPRKRMKVKDEDDQQPAIRIQHKDIPIKSGDSLDAHRIDGAAPSLEEDTDNLTAVPQETKTGGGLVSPKLDDVSEEGEVEP